MGLVVPPSRPTSLLVRRCQIGREHINGPIESRLDQVAQCVTDVALTALSTAENDANTIGGFE